MYRNPGSGTNVSIAHPLKFFSSNTERDAPYLDIMEILQHNTTRYCTVLLSLTTCLVTRISRKELRTSYRTTKVFFSLLLNSDRLANDLEVYSNEISDKYQSISLVL